MQNEKTIWEKLEDKIKELNYGELEVKIIVHAGKARELLIKKEYESIR
jgi:hypothetical protein